MQSQHAEIGLCGFGPSARRGFALDYRMRQRLADSVAYIGRRAARRLGITRASLGAGVERIRRDRVSPFVFGAYSDLVLALDAGDERTARTCLAEIAAAATTPSSLQVVAFGADRDDASWERLARLVETDRDVPVRLQPPSSSATRRCEARIQRALALLDRSCPRLAGEIRALLRFVVIASAPDTPGDTEFGGASSFLLWGAIVLNERAQRSDLDVALSLAHESGHNLLFGLSADGPLVRNDAQERLPSPLRSDLRPMDGIFHATYVIARMHLTLLKLLESEAVRAADFRRAEKQLRMLEQQFSSGMATIDRYARLTPVGQAVLGAARRYMGRHANGRARVR